MALRLSEIEVSRIVDKLLSEWKLKNLVACVGKEQEIRHCLIDIFIQDLKVEEDLHKEIENILSKYEKQFESGALDRRKMFSMVKAQLVKERKIIL